MHRCLIQEQSSQEESVARRSRAENLPKAECETAAPTDEQITVVLMSRSRKFARSKMTEKVVGSHGGFVPTSLEKGTFYLPYFWAANEA
jgi:hypothetical protein